METRDLLQKIVEMAGGASDRGYILAFRTEGLDALPPFLDTGAGRYEVRYVDTELSLRRTILKSNGAPFIALVTPELGHRLGNDVVLRARGRRIHGLEVVDILETVLGVRVMGTDDERLQRLALKHIDAIKAEMEHRTRPTQIDRDLLDELLLDVCVGARVRGAPPGELLATWIRQPPEWEPALAALVQRYLPKLHITEGRILAWALAQPERLRALLVHGVLLEGEEDLAPAVWGPLSVLATELNLDQRTLRTSVFGMAREAVASLDAAVGPFLTEAERLGRQLLPPGQLAKSSLLLLGLDDRLLDLAKRAAQGQVVSAEEIATARRHRAFKMREPQVKFVEELARLTRWLARPRPTLTQVSEYVREYQMHGAFADRCAARIMKAKASVLDYNKQVGAVIDAYRARRDDENKAFAEAVARDYTAGLFQGGAVPLQKIWTEVIGKASGALERKEGRTGGLFLCVLDGCSYPTFLELLSELVTSPSPVGLTTAARPGEPARGFDVLAPLPTITSYARGALFLGKLPNDPTKPGAEDAAAEAVTDKARFNQNDVLGARTRRLFLKADLADGGQSLLESLGGPDDVVGAVFNAIDDQIGSTNTGARLQVKAEEIAGLIPSLRAALKAGRRVLLAADHGHTPFWSKDDRVGGGEAPRWRKLEGNEPPTPGFLEIDLHGLGNVQGRHAFAWKTGAYQGNPQVGFHGGCSLEEMVAPVAWLVRDGVQADDPAWWYGGGTPTAQQPVLAVPARVAPTLPPPPSVPAAQQVELIPTIDSVAAGVAGLGLPEAVLSLLDGAERAALVVLAQNLTAQASELGPKLGKPTARIPGFMTMLKRKLFTAGVVCFESTPLPSGEPVYRWIPPAARNG
jgi:hypothetical protein